MIFGALICIQGAFATFCAVFSEVLSFCTLHFHFVNNLFDMNAPITEMVYMNEKYFVGFIKDSILFDGWIII